MKEQSTYQPEWISADAAANWLGVKKNTLFKWRTSKQLAWTTFGRTPMYDKKQLNKILNEGSTYKMQGLKLETA